MALGVVESLFTVSILRVRRLGTSDLRYPSMMGLS